MSKKLLSPYCTKILRCTKVQNVKCRLSAYQTRNIDPANGLEQPLIVFYYEVSASDGSYRKLINKEDAIKAFEQLIEFEKRQLSL